MRQLKIASHVQIGELAELGANFTKLRADQFGGSERIQCPQQRVHPMHNGCAGLRTAGGKRVNVHRIIVAGQRSECELVGHTEPSRARRKTR